MPQGGVSVMTAWREAFGRNLCCTVVAVPLLLGGCGYFTDAATRLAYDLEEASGRLPAGGGGSFTLVHATPSATGECEGPYKVQLDEAGALIIWCYDGNGNTVASFSTTYHGRFVDTARTFIVDKPAGNPLRVELARRNGRPTIVGAS